MINKFLIKHPHITEKAGLSAQMGKYVFIVENSANKSEVKKIVEREYKVHVIAVHVSNVRAKERFRGKIMMKKPGYKKITVTLKKGEKLDILPQ